MRFHRYRAPILLPAVLLLAGCADLFLSSEERTRRREALAMVERVGVLGASLSAGFGTGRTLADILDAAIRARHEVIDASDPFFFRDPVAAGQRSAALLVERQATCVIALDYLFWFAHGKKTGDRRMADIEEGLRRVEDLGCPVFLGDLPDMRGAAADMLPPESIPGPEELAALNARIEEWAQGRERVHILPLAAWARAADRASLLQPDGLHPSAQGQIRLAVRCLEILKGSRPGFRGQDFLLAPERLSRKITDLPAAVVVEVVDDAGERVQQGYVRFDIDSLAALSLPTSRQLALAGYRHLLEPQPLAGRNPLEIRDLPADLFPGKLRAAAEAPGFVPAEEAEFMLAAGGTTRVRLVLPRPSEIEVMAVDASTGQPIPGVRVRSLTEARARALDDSAVQQAIAAGLTGADGRCALGGLRPGAHVLTLDGGGYSPVVLEGIAGEPGARAKAALERLAAPAAVTVRVFDAQGGPIPGLSATILRFLRNNAPVWRTSVTNADGAVRFADLAPGRALLELDHLQWLRLARERRFHEVTGRPVVTGRFVRLDSGQSAAVELGFLQGPHALTVRAVRADGRPAAGVEVTLMGVGDPGDLEGPAWSTFAGHGPDVSIYVKVKADAAGEATFQKLPPGNYDAAAGGGRPVRASVPAAGRVAVRVE
jgi:5-hydroxyisourate hydrolase-like protein (transthyretin family)